MPRIKEAATRWQTEQRRKQEIGGELAVAKVIRRVLDEKPANVKQNIIARLQDAGMPHGAQLLREQWKMTE